MVKIGIAFPDFISTEKIHKRRSIDSLNRPLGLRYTLLFLILSITVILFFFRLFSLQVIEGSYFRGLSDGNRIKTVTIYAPRGSITDRNGEPLVFNNPGFRRNIDGKAVFLTQEKALAEIASGRDEGLEIDSLRFYPHREVTAHILGYLGQITENELSSQRYSGYRSGDVVGRGGIEDYYEGLLKGVDGRQLVEIDSSGKTIRKLGQTDPIPGKNISLTVDLSIQKKAYDAMQDVERGAVIVTTPKGEILALVSKPSFDPNLFTQGDGYRVASESSYKSVSEILNDNEKQPFLNRAIAGLYPPGSTFKIVSAASGLMTGLIDRNYTVVDTGIIHIGEFSFSNWYYTGYGGTDGVVDVIKGMARSNDIFFYKLAERVGVDRLSKTTQDFGVDDRPKLDLFGVKKGVAPSSSWKKENIGEPWYLGDTYHYGIGQGFLLSTPLHVNTWAQAVATGGDIYEPYLLKDSLNRGKRFRENLLNNEAIHLIREGMIDSCREGGVAWPLFNFRVKNEKLKIDGKNFLEVPESTISGSLKEYKQIVVACKTGTAEHGDTKGKPHAWITLFAPAYDPQIVITVLAEESGEGSSVAGPIAKEILEEWFSR